ncbi:MAG: heavy-metal-associated domain-containing protein [Gemmatimonadaceae bacterium]
MLVTVGAAIACTGGGDASPSPDTSTSLAAPASTPQTVAISDTSHVVLAVKGMYCASCEKTVVTMLRRTAGVWRADVSIERGEASVAYDSRRTSPEQLSQVVKTLGYDASVKRT